MEFDVNKAIKYFQSVLSWHYGDFNGRVTRKDYWTYAAVVLGVFIVAAIVESIVGLAIGDLASLALLLPNAGMTARRIQDSGKPGAIVWILMIPVLLASLVRFLFAITFGLFGLILFFLPLLWLVDLIALAAFVYVVYLCVQPGTAGANQYGPEPASAV
jgi:uncharacterized membrane protein YhaH (DUF805 family)